jgi:ribosome-binding protein aMBF1 (putative translation factor)
VLAARHARRNREAVRLLFKCEGEAMNSDREMFKRALGKRIKDHRKKLGMKQVDLARSLNIHVGSLRNYEQAKNEMPAWMLYRISVALECSMEDLTGRWE